MFSDFTHSYTHSKAPFLMDSRKIQRSNPPYTVVSNPGPSFSRTKWSVAFLSLGLVSSTTPLQTLDTLR